MINMATSDNTLYSKCKNDILLISRMSHPKLYMYVFSIAVWDQYANGCLSLYSQLFARTS